MSLAVCSLLLLAQLQLLEVTALLSLGCYGKLTWTWLMGELCVHITAVSKRLFLPQEVSQMKESVPTGKEVKCFIIVRRVKLEPVTLTTSLLFFWHFVYIQHSRAGLFFMTWCNTNVLDGVAGVCKVNWSGLTDWWWLFLGLFVEMVMTSLQEVEWKLTMWLDLLYLKYQQPVRVMCFCNYLGNPQYPVKFTSR